MAQERNRVLFFGKLFFSVLLVLSLISTSFSFAAEAPLEITSVTISNKSATVEGNIDSYTDGVIKDTLVYHKQGDYAVYEISLKNNLASDITISQISDNNENEYITYEYDDHPDEMLKSGQALALSIKAIYSVELTNLSKRAQTNNVKFTIGYIENGEEKTAPININPKTGDDIILNVAMIAVSTAGLIICTALGKKKSSKLAAIIIAAIAIGPIAKAASSGFVFALDTTIGIYDKQIVTYDIDGERTELIVGYGETVTLPENPEKAGYTFKGWKDENDENFDKTKPIENDQNIHAVFEANTYSIIFEKNSDDATGIMASQIMTYDTESALSKNRYERAGYEFSGWNTKNDGTGASYDDEENVKNISTGDGVILYVQWVESRRASDIVKRQVNTDDYAIDFTRTAIVSGNIHTANGNGVNKYTEKGKNVYYFRGQISNNNVIWANKCWKIIRTTYTDGTKIIYNGTPSRVEVNGRVVEQCNAAGTDTQISYNGANTFSFNGYSDSPAYVGYMYGTPLQYKELRAESIIFTFANDITYDGSTYTLNGDTVSGTWLEKRYEAANGHHYFCTDGATSCDGAKIGYTEYFHDANYIRYFNIDGYSNIEDFKSVIFANTTDSNAKKIVESWFVDEGLDNNIDDSYRYEDDLEDAIFCNDRSYYSGPLKSKDDNSQNASQFGAVGRVRVKNENNNYEPSLDCQNIDDAFTKEDTVNGNGKLKHKVGLITADELVMAGIISLVDSPHDYLYTGEQIWSASPSGFGGIASEHVSRPTLGLATNNVAAGFSLRPIVSLKSEMKFAEGGDGTKENPYIVEPRL